MTRVVQRVLSLLECFDEQRPSLALREIAARVGLPKATVFRLLATLVDAGYLVQLSNQEYCLSHKLMRLAAAAQRTFSIRDVARPVMLDVLARTRETVDLSILSGRRRVCVDILESPHPLKSIISPGETLPLTAGASAKALLAYQDRAFIDEVLAESDRKINRRALMAELQNVRARGYAHTRSERVPGADAISVPLHDYQGQVRYCLTLTGPTVRFAPNIEKFVSIMLDAGGAISLKLGGPEAPKAAPHAR